MMRRAVLVVALFAVAAWFHFQERYPPATLVTDRAFDFQTPFHGYVETEAATVKGSVRIRLVCFVGKHTETIPLSKQVVEREQMRTAGNRLHIPFSCPASGALNTNEIHLRVRASLFPFGWGATFAVYSRTDAR